jgi:hypothetical protein
MLDVTGIRWEEPRASDPDLCREGAGLEASQRIIDSLRRFEPGTTNQGWPCIENLQDLHNMAVLDQLRYHLCATNTKFPLSYLGEMHAHTPCPRLSDDISTSQGPKRVPLLTTACGRKVPFSYSKIVMAVGLDTKMPALLPLV